jgi:hypothetical protein
MSTTNHTTERVRDELLIAGVEKHLASLSTLTLNGVSYTPAQIVTRLQQRVKLLDAAEAAKAKAHDAVAANKQDRKDISALLQALRSTIIGMFGSSSELLNDFGFVPRTAKKPNVVTKSKALEKRRATRTARHVMGKRQRKQVTGSVAAPASNGSTNANGSTSATPK